MLTKNPHDSSPNGPWRCWHRTIFWFSVIVYNPSADDLERGVIVDRSSKAGDCSGRAKLLLLAPLPEFNCKARCLCQWMAKMWVPDKPSSAGRTVCRRTTKWVVYSGGGTSTSLSSSTNGTSRSSSVACAPAGSKPLLPPARRCFGVCADDKDGPLTNQLRPHYYSKMQQNFDSHCSKGAHPSDRLGLPPRDNQSKMLHYWISWTSDNAAQQKELERIHLMAGKWASLVTALDETPCCIRARLEIESMETSPADGESMAKTWD